LAAIHADPKNDSLRFSYADGLENNDAASDATRKPTFDAQRGAWRLNKN